VTGDSLEKTNSARSMLGNWRFIVVASVYVLWTGAMVVRTGVGTFIALWNVVFLLGVLVVIAMPVRTVTVKELLAVFSGAGATVGLSAFAGWIFLTLSGPGSSRARAFGIPLIEEVLKLAPVLLILWRQRRGRALTFGVTDVMLLAAASGAAFYWLEESFIIHNHRSWSFVGRFPTTDVMNNLVANHAIWSAIGGFTIGIALLLREPRLRMFAVAVSGCLWATVDHAANNYRNHFHDVLSGVLRNLTGNGYNSLYIFLLGFCFAVGLDLYFAYLAMKEPTAARPLGFAITWDQINSRLRYLRLRLQFAYASARYRVSTGNMRERLGTLLSRLGASLRNRPLENSSTRRATV
jgi:RsiW-degrading membrane proteinase PrsW (M82 family)